MAVTVRSPDQAWPRTSNDRPTSESLAGLVISDFTGIRSMMTKSSLSTFSPGATLRLGTR